MKKNKTLSIALAISGIWLALATIFMGFGPGALYDMSGSGKFWMDVPLFDYIFNKGTISQYFASVGINTIHRLVLLVGFVMTIVALAAIITLLVLRFNGKGNKKLELGLTIFAIIMLVYYAISAFLIKQICIADIPNIDPEKLEAIKLGGGAICIGIFGLLGAGCTLGSYLTNPNK